MNALPSIRYDRPKRYVRASVWGREWRLRWFRLVGSVHQHWQTDQLVAFYSDDRDPAVWMALRAELEARPTGVADVLAACREATRSWNRRITEANIRYDAAQRGA